MQFHEVTPKFLRLKQVLAIIPVGRSCWLKGVKEGRYPSPVKLSEKCVAWRAEDISLLVQTLGETQKNIIIIFLIIM